MPNADFSKICDDAHCTLGGKTELLAFPRDVAVFLVFVSNSHGLCFRFSSLKKMLYELARRGSESDLIQKGRQSCLQISAGWQQDKPDVANPSGLLSGFCYGK